MVGKQTDVDLSCCSSLQQWFPFVHHGILGRHWGIIDVLHIEKLGGQAQANALLWQKDMGELEMFCEHPVKLLLGNSCWIGFTVEQMDEASSGWQVGIQVPRLYGLGIYAGSSLYPSTHGHVICEGVEGSYFQPVLEAGWYCPSVWVRFNHSDPYPC